MIEREDWVRKGEDEAELERTLINIPKDGKFQCAQNVVACREGLKQNHNQSDQDNQCVPKRNVANPNSNAKAILFTDSVQTFYHFTEGE